MKNWLRRTIRGAGPEAPVDVRGRRVVAVIECTVNQNVRDAGAANAAALCWQALELCHQHGTGLMVMPCPEIACLGASRQRPPGVSIGEAMRTRRCRQGVAALAVEVADRVQASLDAGTAVLAVLGGNERSPGCAVHDTTSSPEAEVGVFINALRAELQRRGLEIPFRGLRDADPAQLAEDLAWLRTQLGDRAGAADPAAVQAGAADCSVAPTPARRS